ncbi:MAG TPA: rod shape-determining protein MreB [Solirubrobacteraceae bacterium]|nr:rod shape-determining protein MreB [Solirubrobacteraceae bacterium]
MRSLPFWTCFSSSDIAVDLGTANTVLSACGGEIVLSEPSVVVADARSGEPLAAGREALDLLGREGAAAIQPLKHGMIADLWATEELLRHMIRKVRRYKRPKPRVIAAVPTGASGVQRRAVAQACMTAGAREARLVAKPIAAAWGTGLPVEEPTGSMVLDIGAGTTEVAMISMGAIVTSRLIPIGGQELSDRIAAHLKREHAVLVGQQAAEQIKADIGSASPYGHDRKIEIIGRDMGSERLKTMRLTGLEIGCVLERPLARIIEATEETLTRTPPLLACDVMDRGITLIGGGSLLHGLRDRLAGETRMPAHLADAPSTCVAIGASRLVESRTSPVAASWNVRRGAPGWPPRPPCSFRLRCTTRR